MFLIPWTVLLPTVDPIAQFDRVAVNRTISQAPRPKRKLPLRIEYPIALIWPIVCENRSKSFGSFATKLFQ